VVYFGDYLKLSKAIFFEIMALANERQQSLFRTMKLSFFDYSELESVDVRI
jgi:hypothetical protein